MSSPDNSQFEPQSSVSAEQQTSLPVAPDPFLPASDTPTPAAPPPSENPVWNGWDMFLLAVVSALLMIVVVPILVVSGANLLVYTHERWLDVARKPILALLSQFLAYILVAWYMIMLVEGKYHARFWQAIQWNWRRNATLGLLGLGMLTVSLDLLSRFLPMPKTTPFDQFFAHPSDAYLMAAFAVSFGPLMEELFFRGFLYPVLARSIGVAGAVLLTALPFGLIHYLQYKSWAAVLVITMVGVVLTVVRAVTKSVAASFLVHVGYNATLMVFAAVATDGFRHMEKATFALQR